ncbi:MAG TPA: PQQ-dependent sugar dehydrogenase [Pyrinomonadaceae bacterium]|nr:PQQ-dependent sugar dehydrogenase [Pyrinomonadaceae bacterium]
MIENIKHFRAFQKRVKKINFKNLSISDKFPPLTYILLFALVTVMLAGSFQIIKAQTNSPTVLDPNLDVRTVTSGLTTPISMAFLGPNDFFVLEKNTGKVKLIGRGVVTEVLDLAVNNASERGLLGIALHPNFPINPRVYLYWTCLATPPPADNPFFPTATECPDQPAVGADTNVTLAVPLLGNRVDSFVWNAGARTLTFDRNIIKLRVFQHDGAPVPPGQGDQAQNPAGNHDGGVIRFGPDGKLYIIIGDVGRRGQMQNLPSGPTATGLGPTVPDDQFGGPEPDNAHLTGVILRLNDDGSTPSDNPFFHVGRFLPGEVGANIQKIFAYGIRNSFGMAFDPKSGNLWTQENCDDAFDELNLVDAGSNSGWIQFMGPASRIAEFKAIETSPPPFFGLQQLRFPPTRLANSPAEGMARLFNLRWSHYSDPEFSWKYAVAPAGIGFMEGRGIGPQYEGDLFVGAARTFLENGYLFHFNLTGNRRRIAVDDPRVEDRVADNFAKFDITESEEFLFGRNFGIGTDIHTGPNGNLFVVSLSNGEIYEIFRR